MISQNIKVWTGLLIAGLFWQGTSNASATESSRSPNVVVILTDDQGWGDLSLHGNLDLQTPNVDAIAQSGAQFRNFYVSPVCSPTRAEFLTGRYHPRTGVRNVTSGGERLNLDETTIADYFRQSGYQTGAFGKWHNGSQYPYHPKGRGFDEYYGFTSGHWGDYFSPPLEHNGEIVQGQGFIADDITNHAISFMKENRENPFLCYIAYNTPHSPMQVPDSFYHKYRDKELQSRYHGTEKQDMEFTRAALAMCENLDFNIGRIIRTLDNHDLSENTIIVYFHDNGPNGWRFNGGMKGRKGSTDEGGVRSPLFLKWPSRIQPGKTVDCISSTIDILPTLIELTGIQSKYKNPLDGISFASVLTQDSKEPEGRMIFSHWAGRVSVRTQSHRLDDRGRLFDMITDPGQTKNIREIQPKLAKQLESEVQNWRKEVLVGIQGKDSRPFPVGYEAFPLTHLPARDALFSGSVKRSAPAPNCSFLTEWNSEDDRIYWPVAIETSGEYEMLFHHTISSQNTGVTIELYFDDQLIKSFQLTEAFESSLRGMENDRVSRGSESYVKDFQPLSVKGVKLPAANGQISLRAKNVKGGSVADLRGISLRLQPSK